MGDEKPKMKDLIWDFVRDYLNGIDDLGVLTENLIFWKRAIQAEGITADEYFERYVEDTEHKTDYKT